MYHVSLFYTLQFAQILPKYKQFYYNKSNPFLNHGKLVSHHDTGIHLRFVHFICIFYDILSFYKLENFNYSYYK